MLLKLSRIKQLQILQLRNTAPSLLNHLRFLVIGHQQQLRGIRKNQTSSQS